MDREEIAKSAESTVDIIAAIAAEINKTRTGATTGFFSAKSDKIRSVMCSVSFPENPGNWVAPTIPTVIMNSVVTNGMKTMI